MIFSAYRILPVSVNTKTREARDLFYRGLRILIIIIGGNPLFRKKIE